MRVVAGIVVGLLAAMTAIVIVGIVAIGTTLSLPPGTDPGNMGQVYAIMTAMPQSTRIALAMAWFAGALGAATVAKLISRKAWLAWALALLVTLYVGYDGVLLRMQISVLFRRRRYARATPPLLLCPT